MQKNLLLLILLGLTFFSAKGQDPQLSQFYAAPLYLNPAFAGSTQATRAVANYRNQWPNLDANFVTYVASFDHYFRKFNSGIGVLGYFDKEGDAGFRTYTVAVQYAYQLHLNDKLTFRPGLQAGFSNRNLNSFGLVFGDQLGNDGTQIGETSELLSFKSASYFDISAGGILYSDKFWIGFSTHHLNHPNQSVATNEKSPLPIKASIHLGYRIPLKTGRFGERREGPLNEEREVSITPALNFKHQGPFNQLDAGIYFTYDPLTFGLWYRGIPMPAYKGGTLNNDALIFLMGYKIQDLTIGYSYDLTISKLGPSTGGAHEISLIYDFYLGYRNQKRKTPPKNVRRMPCPRF